MARNKSSKSSPQETLTPPWRPLNTVGSHLESPRHGEKSQCDDKCWIRHITTDRSLPSSMSSTPYYALSIPYSAINFLVVVFLLVQIRQATNEEVPFPERISTPASAPERGWHCSNRHQSSALRIYELWNDKSFGKAEDAMTSWTLYGTGPRSDPIAATAPLLFSATTHPARRYTVFTVPHVQGTTTNSQTPEALLHAAVSKTFLWIASDFLGYQSLGIGRSFKKSRRCAEKVIYPGGFWPLLSIHSILPPSPCRMEWCLISHSHFHTTWGSCPKTAADGCWSWVVHIASRSTSSNG